MSQQRSEDEALRAVAVMEQGKVVDFDRATALEAARLSIQHRIAMADSVMLATAQRHGATLWTQDSDFDGLPGVEILRQALIAEQLSAPGLPWVCVACRGARASQPPVRSAAPRAAPAAR